MAASVEYRQEEMSFGETKEKENREDLSMFVDCSGVNLNLDILHKSNQIHVTSDSEFENQLKPEPVSIIHGQDSGSDDLLSSLKNVTDYEWLLSPPRLAVHSQEMQGHTTHLSDHILISNDQSTSPESKLENASGVGTLTTNISVKLPTSSINGVKSSTTIRRPSPSRKAPSTGSRSATPTTRTKPLRSSTPTCRGPVTAPTKPVARSTTPTPRPPVLTVSSKSTSRSSTPSQRPSILPVASKSTSSSRSSTPAQRPSIPASAKSASRSSTPTQRPSNTSVFPNRSSSATKSRPSKNQPEMNLKPVPKRASCSPSRAHVGVKSVITRGRGHSNEDDDVNPVLMGTKMVERVVNMRKLAPPRQEDNICNQNNASGKLSVSQDNSGFGRSLSKKSFDMALRHLDIRRSMPGNMRATITKVPASSVYSVRPESTKTRTTSASDSHIATSSSTSSEHSETGHSYHQPSGRSVAVGFLCEP